MKTLKISGLIILTALFCLRAGAQISDVSKSINTIVSDYLDLKNALISADGNLAEAKAKVLLASIQAAPVKAMTPKQLAVWKTYEPKLEFDSRHISEVSLVPHQREHFAGLSNNLYSVLKEFKLNKIVLYRQYCVMDKQYYLSDAATGKDPYMAMEHCSRVAETLPANK